MLELDSLLTRDEGPKLDFKREYKVGPPPPEAKTADWSTLQNGQWHEMVRDIISLTNGCPGTVDETAYLVIGVGDKRLANGKRELFDVQHLNLKSQTILDKLLKTCSPPIAQLICHEIKRDCKTLYIIEIPPSPLVHESACPLITWKGIFDTKSGRFLGLESSSKNYTAHVVFYRVGEAIHPACSETRRRLEYERRKAICFKHTKPGLDTTRELLDERYRTSVLTAEEFKVRPLASARSELGTLILKPYLKPTPNKCGRPCDSIAIPADDFLGSARSPEAKRLLVRGAAGSGKTTLIKFLAVRGVEEYGVMPFACPLRQAILEAGKSYFDPILACATRVANILGKRESDRASIASWVEHSLERGDGVLFFDGIDEIPANTEIQINLRNTLVSVAHRFPRAPIIITSRLGSCYDSQMGRPFEEQLMAPLSSSQIYQYASHHLSATQAQFLLNAARRTPPLQALLTTPLFLDITTFLVAEHNVESLLNPPVLLSRVIEHLLSQELRPLRALVDPPISLSCCRRLLEYLAFCTLDRYGNCFSADHVSEVILVALRAAEPEHKWTLRDAQLLVGDMQACRIVQRAENGQLAFFHPQIQEFLTAAHLASIVKSKSTRELIKVLDRKVWHAHWTEVFKFLASMLKPKMLRIVVGNLLRKKDDVFCRRVWICSRMLHYSRSSKEKNALAKRIDRAIFARLPIESLFVHPVLTEALPQNYVNVSGLRTTKWITEILWHNSICINHPFCSLAVATNSQCKAELLNHFQELIQQINGPAGSDIQGGGSSPGEIDSLMKLFNLLRTFNLTIADVQVQECFLNYLESANPELGKRFVITALLSEERLATRAKTRLFSYLSGSTTSSTLERSFVGISIGSEILNYYLRNGQRDKFSEYYQFLKTHRERALNRNQEAELLSIIEDKDAPIALRSSAAAVAICSSANREVRSRILCDLQSFSLDQNASLEHMEALENSPWLPEYAQWVRQILMNPTRWWLRSPVRYIIRFLHRSDAQDILVSFLEKEIALAKEASSEPDGHLFSDDPVSLAIGALKAFTDEDWATTIAMNILDLRKFHSGHRCLAADALGPLILSDLTFLNCLLRIGDDESENPDVRAKCLSILGMRVHKLEVINALQRIVSVSHIANVRCSAIKALTLCVRTASVFSQILRLIEDRSEDKNVRKAAIEVLSCEWADRTVLSSILQVAKNLDESCDLRCCAARFLAKAAWEDHECFETLMAIIFQSGLKLGRDDNGLEAVIRAIMDGSNVCDLSRQVLALCTLRKDISLELLREVQEALWLGLDCEAWSKLRDLFVTIQTKTDGKPFLELILKSELWLALRMDSSTADFKSMLGLSRYVPLWPNGFVIWPSLKATCLVPDVGLEATPIAEHEPFSR